MPSKDTIPYHLTKETASKIEYWRKQIASVCGVDVSMVTKKQGEVALRLSSERGNVLINELKEILMGKRK